VQSLAISLEAKDSYTQGHSEAVAELAVQLGRRLGLPASDLEVLELAGRLHDIGKIGVRESVLNKPGPLTPEEFEHVKEHAALGARILGPIAENGRLSSAVRHHHENWDGTGYPDGLKEADIPLFAQILRVCDIYEALTSDRPYRPARSRQEARDIMEEETGRTMAPDIGTVFFSLLASGLPEYRGVAPRGEKG
jgi:putative nucleotidyltransferase with HDIG domain